MDGRSPLAKNGEDPRGVRCEGDSRPSSSLVDDRAVKRGGYVRRKHHEIVGRQIGRSSSRRRVARL